MIAERDDADQVRREQHAQEDEHRCDKREQREDCARHVIGFVLFIVREQTGIDRDERSGERALAKDVLQKVWDAQRDVEGVAHIGRAEVVGHDALAH